MQNLIFNFFKKDCRTQGCILKNAFESFDFDYEPIHNTGVDSNNIEASFSDAVENLPSEVFDLKEVDYYA
jgi:hypothetical protein